ncbi:sel1 repeat family protein [Vibrio anguillarum]|uniref:tetratricopeptide repeat protein n=1 Tax=Vibrio anguillarum TaxID=55601 RepID=UPI001D197C2A|nr:tetratricopeptide repeat protein [Vibrio anguillarum]MCC4237582.1 sel1 repeat family protein [Vibrio anguillarum]
MLKRKWLASTIVTLMLSGCAATYESAEEAYQDGDYAKARESWQKLALEGDNRSMYRLYTSTNHPSNEDIGWLKKAADSGLVNAQFDYGMHALKQEKFKEAQAYLIKASENKSEKASKELADNKDLFPLWLKAEESDAYSIKKLGKLYWEKKEYKQSLKWYERCVDSYKSCSFYIGLAFDNGYGVSQDYEKSIYWYTKSAGQDHGASARNLAWIYEEGKGVHIDKKKAFQWMKKSSETNWLGQAELGRYYLFGIGTEKNTAKAFSLLSEAAPHTKYASYNLARMYYYGDGLKQNYKKSYEYFSKASNQNHSWSDYFIGNHYYYGYGKEKSYTQAHNWFEKAANAGVVDAQFRLGWMLSNGEGTTANARAAFKWYQKAAEQGSIAAQNNLGVMYAEGNGVEKDDYKAFKWYEKAARQGDDVAQKNLGVRYEIGKGVRQSNQLAAFWYAKSAQQNHKEAQSYLNEILNKLRTKTVQIKKASVYKEGNFDSKELLTLQQGQRVYVLSSGSKWTEVYVPKNHTIGYLNNTHLY